MKKVSLALALLSFAGAANAQINSGTTLLSGSINYSHRQEEVPSSYGSVPPADEMSSFTFAPTVGYFISENLALGITADISNANAKKQQYDPYQGSYREVEMSLNTLTIGPMMRYYKFMGDNLAFYGQLGAGYASSNSRPAYATAETKGTGFYGQLMPGIAYFPIPKLGLELNLKGLRYGSITEKYTSGNRSNETTSSGLDLGFGLQDVNLGVSFYLGR